MKSQRGHLTKEEFSSYVQRGLQSVDLLAVDDHLGSCSQCMRLFEAHNSSHPKTSLVEGMLGSVEVEHLTFEQLADYVDKQSDEIDKSIIELHLKDCDVCRSDVAEMAALRDEIAAADRAPIQTVHPVRWSGWKILIHEFVLLLLGIGLFLSLSAPSVELSAGPQEVQIPEIELPPGLEGDLNTSTAQDGTELAVSLRDGGGTIGLSTEGTLVGADGASPQLSQTVKNVLETGNLRVGEKVAAGNTGVLMGGNRDGIPFGLTGPVGTVVSSQRPVFSWKPLAGAEGYSVKIFDEKFSEVMSGDEVSGTSWTPTKPLLRGRTYLWQVAARKGGETVISPVRPAPEARFKIVDSADAESIDIAEKRFSRSNLIRGIAYAKAGMLAEAEREFAALARKNPDSALAQRLLQQVRRPR